MDSGTYIASQALMVYLPTRPSVPSPGKLLPLCLQCQTRLLNTKVTRFDLLDNVLKNAKSQYIFQQRAKEDDHTGINK